MQKNADIVRNCYAAFHRGDIDGVLALFSSDIEWTHPIGMNDHGLGGTVRGHQEVRAFMTRARALFSTLRPVPREFVASGESVAVLGTHHMRAAGSGMSGTIEFVHSWRLHNGQATHFRDFHDTAEVRCLLGSNQVADDPAEPIIRLGFGFWSSNVVRAAIELGVFSTLASRELDVAELSTALGIHERGARDFFDALVALHLLDRAHGRYHNTPVSETFLDPAKTDTYLGAYLEMMNEQGYQPWAQLTDALVTGKPQYDLTAGESDPYTVLYADADRARRFQLAMTNVSAGGIEVLAERFPWSKYRTVADVGCSEGTLLARVLTMHPHLTAVGFDLPPVASCLAETVASFDLADRMSFVSGDFFTDPMPNADVIVLGHVLHNWNPATKRMLLRKAHEALPVGGAVIVHETLIDDERRHTAFGLLGSLNMLVLTPDGLNFTGADCRGWLSEAGFGDSTVERLTGRESIVVGIK
jgi:ketosteroid isomerase-like protein/SAM-dependent methyltransferase